MIIACSEEVSEDAMNNVLIERIRDIVENPTYYKLDKISVDMFRKHYFFEESINEIASKYEKKYHTVRNRIEKIKEKRDKQREENKKVEQKQEAQRIEEEAYKFEFRGKDLDDLTGQFAMKLSVETADISGGIFDMRG